MRLDPAVESLVPGRIDRVAVALVAVCAAKGPVSRVGLLVPALRSCQLLLTVLICATTATNATASESGQLLPDRFHCPIQGVLAAPHTEVVGGRGLGSHHTSRNASLIFGGGDLPRNRNRRRGRRTDLAGAGLDGGELGHRGIECACELFIRRELVTAATAKGGRERD